MAKLLDVYLHGSRVGQLEQDRHGLISFQYTAAWLAQPGATSISQSLPLKPEPFEGKECHGFFGGVLPEENSRKLIAQILGISVHNDFAMLDELGGECAGAISFLPTGAASPSGDNAYQLLSEEGLAAILEELPQRPLLAGKKDIRLSLAGAQTKLCVFVDERGISLPLHGSPSTHILKPVHPHFESLVENEAFCLDLAARAGLPTAPAITGSAKGIGYLLVKRYDREWMPDGELRRLHQEDFCQALGLPSQLKYQNEGGPSLGQCFALLRAASTMPARDLLNLFDAIIYNFLIGNNDAHGKNFSLIYPFPGQTATRLAPLYDLVSTSQYSGLSPKMAMKIGSKYLPSEIRLRHWETLWEQAGFLPSQARRRTLQFIGKITDALSKMTLTGEIHSRIADDVSQRCKLLRQALEKKG